MSGIRGKDTTPELIVRHFLHRSRLRFRLHDGRLPGRPDLVFARYRAVVQVHGCFWHHHEGCPFAFLPATRPRFWHVKLKGNAARDRRNDARLRALGWRVFTVWECQVGDVGRLARLARAIIMTSRRHGRDLQHSALTIA
jgi:DNA mismatch endonuclease (patch repair protein)